MRVPLRCRVFNVFLSGSRGRICPAPPPRRGGLAPAVLRRVIDFAEANLGSALAIGDLAEVAGLSPYHFARMFKRSTGESPHGFVLRRRIERAKALLGQGRPPLAEVALARSEEHTSELQSLMRSSYA